MYVCLSASLSICLIKCYVAVKRYYGHDNYYKGKDLTGLAYIFIGLVHFSYGGEIDSM